MRDSALNALKMFNEGHSYNPGGGIVVDGQRYMIEFIEYDDRTDTKRAVAGMTMMKDLYDVNMILGPMTSPNCLASQPISEARKIICSGGPSAAACTREGINYTFNPVIPHSARANAFCAYYLDYLEARKVAILTQNYATYTDMSQGYRDGCNDRAEVEIVADEKFEMEVKDYSTIITRLRKDNPDILFVSSSPANSILIVKQIYEMGWNVVIGSTADVVSDDLFRVTGPAANELFASMRVGYWALVKGKASQALKDALGLNEEWYMEVSDSYIEEYTDANMTFATWNYDILLSFVECMQQSGTVDDIGKLHNTMLTLEFYAPSQFYRMLPVHKYQAFAPVAVFYESELGADNFEILAVVTHTDDYMKVWEVSIAQEYEKIPELRAKRGY